MSAMIFCLILASIVPNVTSFQAHSFPASTMHRDLKLSRITKEAKKVISIAATATDAEVSLEASDIGRMIDESANSLMKRFWEIDLQTKRRMDMILRLYEVHQRLSFNCIEIH